MIFEAHKSCIFNLNGVTHSSGLLYIAWLKCNEKLMLEHDSFGVHHAVENRK